MTQKQYRLMLRKLFHALEIGRISITDFTGMVEDLKEIRAKFLSIDSVLRGSTGSYQTDHYDRLVKVNR